MSPTFNAIMQSQTLTESTVIDRSHPPVCNIGEVVADGIYAKGQFLARVTADGADKGKLCKYTKANDQFAGVNTEAIDSTKEPMSVFLEHGCYVLAECLVAGAVPDNEDIAIAAAKGCWAR